MKYIKNVNNIVIFFILVLTSIFISYTYYFDHLALVNVSVLYNDEIYKDLYEINNLLLTIRKGIPYKWLIFNKYLEDSHMINCDFINLEYVVDKDLTDDENRVVFESLISIRRSGAYSILTYFAKEVAYMIRNNKFNDY